MALKSGKSIVTAILLSSSSIIIDAIVELSETFLQILASVISRKAAFSSERLSVLIPRLVSFLINPVASVLASADAPVTLSAAWIYASFLLTAVLISFALASSIYWSLANAFKKLPRTFSSVKSVSARLALFALSLGLASVNFCNSAVPETDNSVAASIVTLTL